MAPLARPIAAGTETTEVAYRLRAESHLPRRAAGRGPSPLVLALVCDIVLVAALAGFASASSSAPAWVWAAAGVAAAIGALLVVLAARRLVARWRFGEAVVSVPKRMFHPDDEVAVRIRQTLRGRVEPDDVRLRLLLRETAVYRQGRTLSTRAEDHILDSVSFKDARGEIASQLDSTASFRLPGGAMHSLLTPYNRLQYFLEVTVTVPRGLGYVERFELPVLPRAPGTP